jgi:putative flippase GtrA
VVTEKITKKHADKLIFAGIGATNTVIDFIILNVLSLVFGLPKIGANVISTSVTMVISFFANKKFTFKSNSKNYRREIVLFFVFTMIGLYIIQNLVISLLSLLLPTDLGEFWRLNIAKVLATGVSMVWNFITYKKFVFKKPSSRHSGLDPESIDPELNSG